MTSLAAGRLIAIVSISLFWFRSSLDSAANGSGSLHQVRSSTSIKHALLTASPRTMGAEGEEETTWQKAEATFNGFVSFSAYIAPQRNTDPPANRKRFSEFYDPCQEAADRSMRCLHRNPRDKDICSDYFQSVLSWSNSNILRSIATCIAHAADRMQQSIQGLQKGLGIIIIRPNS